MDPLNARGTDHRPWGLAVAAVAAISCYAALNFLGNIRTHLPRYFAIITAAMGLMLLTYRAWDLIAGKEEGIAVRWVIATAVFFRLAVIPLSPSLSDDAYRYAWDGMLLAHGFNPYAHVPESDEVRELRNEAYTHISYKDYHTLYPPITEVCAAGAAWISEHLFDGSVQATILIWKLILCVADVASMLLILRLLIAWGMPMKRLLLYAWHPLPIIEFAGQGHSDALMIPCVLWTLLALQRNQKVNGVLAFAAGIAARAIPLIFSFTLARLMGWRRVALGILVACLLVLPFCSTEALIGAYDSASRMGSVFVFNSFGFWILYGGLHLVHGWLLQPYITPFLGAVFLALLVVISLRSKAKLPRDVPRTMLAICSLFVLVLWNMHPWYFSWGLSLVPFIVSWGWVWSTFAVQFTYVHYTPHSDVALLVVGIVEYTGFIVLLILQRRIDVARHAPRP